MDIYCITTFYCLLPSFLQIHIKIYVNFLSLLLYQAKSHTMDALILNRYYYYYYYYYYFLVKIYFAYFCFSRLTSNFTQLLRKNTVEQHFG